MAGICHSVLIVEAEEKSGSLITARLALDYNRDVFAIPGNITSSNSYGTNILIRDGASPITCGADLREALGFARDTNQNEKTELVFTNPHEELLYSLLREPKTKEDLFIESNLSISDFNITLSMMDLGGLIEESDGFISKA